MRSIKQMLKEQDLVVGLTVQHVCDPWIAKVYANVGAGFIYIENEHTLLNRAALGKLVLYRAS